MMRFQLGRHAMLAIAVLLLIGFCADAYGQRRRTKRSRRVTNPVATQRPAPTSSAPTSEPTIISTADETSTDVGAATTRRRSRAGRSLPPETDEEVMRRQVDRLSTQVSALNDKLTQMELQQRTLVDLERLTRAESRGETLRAQLRDVQAKEAELQARAEQIEFELQPSIIERTLAVSGSTRPEELREQRRRQLESERSRLQVQLSQFATSRARLEAAIASAESEADRIRARVDAATAPEQTETTSVDTGAAPAGTPPPTDIGEGEPD